MRNLARVVLMAGAAALAAGTAFADPPADRPVMGPPADSPLAPPDAGMAPPAPSDGDAADQEPEQERMRYAPELPEGTPPDIAERAASAAPVTTLTDALRMAYWTSPQLLAQRALLRSVDFRVPQARAGFGPKLSYQLADVFQRDSTEPTAIQRRFGQNTSTVQRGFSTSAQAILTWPLFTFGRTFAAERYAVAQRTYQEQVLRSAEQQALLDALTAYVGVLRDRAGVDIARDNLATLQTEQSDNEARFKVREVTATDVQQVITRAELGRAQLFGAQRDIANSEAEFAQKIGVPPGELAPANPLEMPVRTLEEAYAYAELHNPVLLAAHAREKVSRAGVESARADLMPQLNFRASAAYASQSPYNNAARYKEQRGELVLSGPIFESGLRQARVAEAMAANDSDWRLIDAALRDNRASLAQAWNEWKTQEAATARYALAVDAAQKALDGAQLQERAGMVTTLDVLQLARELLTARSNYNSAIAAAYIFRARALATMGALEQRWLLPDDARYDAAEHYDRVRHRGDVPLITPLLRALDGAPVRSREDRAVRDPGAKVETPAARLELPGESVAGARSAPLPGQPAPRPEAAPASTPNP